MPRNANGQRFVLTTDLGTFDSEEDYQRALWTRKMDEEEKRQIEHGYDDAHDREHGVEHLLNWAIDYGRRGKNLEAATMTRKALWLIRNPSSPISGTTEQTGAE
jgi:hypothetical protein